MSSPSAVNIVGSSMRLNKCVRLHLLPFLLMSACQSTGQRTAGHPTPVASTGVPSAASQQIDQIQQQAEAALKAGCIDEAAAFIEQILLRKQALVGTSDPSFVMSLQDLGVLRMLQEGRLRDAATILRRAHTTLQAQAPRFEHEEFYRQGLYWMAQVYIRLEDPRQALPYQREYVERLAAAAKAGQPISDEKQGEVLSDLGRLQFQTGMPAEAAVTLTKARTLQESLPKTKRYPGLCITLRHLADTLIALGRRSEAGPLLEQTVALAEETQGRDSLDAANWLNVLSGYYDDSGNLRRAEAILLRQLEILDKLADPNIAFTLFSSLNNLGELYRKQERFAEAEARYEKARALAARALSSEPRLLAIVENNLGLLRDSQHHWKESEEHFLRAQALYRTAGDRSAELLRLQNNLASLSKSQGLYRQALERSQEALKEALQLYPAGAPELGIFYHTVASMYVSLEEFGEAGKYYELALAAWAGDRDGHALEHADGLEGLGLVRKQQGRLDEARDLYEKALAGLRRVHGRPHSSIGTCLANMGELYRVLGEYGRAEEHLSAAKAEFAASVGEQSVEYARLLNSQAELARARHERARAEFYEIASLRLREQLLGKEHPDVAASLNNLAQLRLEERNFADAVALELRACAIWKRAQLRHKIALCNNNLALMNIEGGEFKHAAEALAVVQSIYDADLAPNAPQQIVLRINMAELDRAQGRLDAADAQLADAYRRVSSATHSVSPLMSAVLIERASLRLQQKRFGEAKALLARVFELEESELRRIRTGARLTAMLDGLRGHEEAIYGTLLQDPRDPIALRLALVTALLRKGRALDEEAATTRLIRSAQSDARLRINLAQLQDVQDRLDALSWSKSAESLRAVLERQMQDIERAIVAAFQPFSAKLPGPSDVVQAVRDRLPENAALVEFVTTAPYLPQATKNQPRWGEPHYIALVLRKDGAISAQVLGPARQIEHRVAELWAVLRSPTATAISESSQLYQLTLGKLAPQCAFHPS